MKKQKENEKEGLKNIKEIEKLLKKIEKAGKVIKITITDKVPPTYIG